MIEQTPGIPVVRTMAEAAVILRVKESWLERQAAARKIPFTMLGGAYHFTAEHLTVIVRINERLPVGESERTEHARREPRVRPTANSGSVTALRPRPRTIPRRVA